MENTQKHIIQLKVPSKAQYLQLLRLSTSSIANQAGFDIDDVEDLRVIISELVTDMIPVNEEINVEFTLCEESMKIEVYAKNLAYISNNQDNINMKKQILETLTDQIEIGEQSISIIKNK